MSPSTYDYPSIGWDNTFYVSDSDKTNQHPKMCPIPLHFCANFNCKGIQILGIVLRRLDLIPIMSLNHAHLVVISVASMDGKHGERP